VIAGEEYRDAYQYTWALWWTKQAVFEPGKGLSHLTLMNHPLGIEHPFMLTMATVNLTALPFSLLFPPATVYNCQILLSFILSGMTMYWFCTELTNDQRAGLTGGFIFAFFLNKTGHVLGGHLPQVTVYWFPLYALFLWRVVEKPKWQNGLKAGLVLIPASLVHVMHIPYLILPITLAILSIKVLTSPRSFFTWKHVGALALTFGLAALVVAPVLWPTVMDSLKTNDYLFEKGTVEHATDLLAFFTPSRYHPVLQPLGLIPPFAQRVFNNERTLREGLAYSGIIATGLALCGVYHHRRKTWCWAILGVGAAVLSLGPLLRVGKELVTYHVDVHKSYIVLPYALLKQIPILKVGRTPSRLNEFTMFALAILASYGISYLSSQLSDRPSLLNLLVASLLISIGFEYVAIWPFPTGNAKIPDPIQNIAGEQSEGALLHIPMKRRRVNHQALYYQTVTQRPIIGGEAHRSPPEVPPWSKSLLEIAEPDPANGDVIPRPDLNERKRWLHYFDVDYVVFHDLEYDKLGPEADQFYRKFAQTLLGTPKYTDDILTVFPVPDEVSPPTEPYLYTFGRNGWYSPQQDGSILRRWMYNNGELYLYSTREENGALRFNVDSHLDFPLLEVYRDDQLLETFVVDERTTYTSRPFMLTKGMNVFRFHAPGGCPDVLDDPHCWSDALMEPPAGEAPLPCDAPTTCRTFVFDNLSFVPQREFGPGDGISIDFGNKMRLRGWELSTTTLRPGDMLTVTLSWQAIEELNRHYVVFTHLLSPNRKLVAQHDEAPVEELVPAKSWTTNSVFRYPASLELPSDLPTGNYRLLVGVYLWPSMERLPIFSSAPSVHRDNRIEIDTITVFDHDS
jgi:hypothetical protein